MICLEQNIKALCVRHGIEHSEFLGDLSIEHAHELSIFDLQAICEEYAVDMHALLFKPMFRKDVWKQKAGNIKLLVMDVDGVLTDGGMYISESGDQIKKYNAKDGMAIQFLRKNGVEPCIISSSLTSEMVNIRAKMLGIVKCYVGKEAKIEILNRFCEELKINLDQVAMIGDDINDLAVIQKIGFSACPADAVNQVKSHVDVILSKNGGQGCVREFIDLYLLKEPISY
ncbi:MAG: HAD-IIIA family hydrolase [Bacteroidota bacterium]